MHSNLHMLDSNGSSPLHQSCLCKGQLKDWNANGVDTEKNTIDARNIMWQLQMLLVYVGRYWNCNRCYKLGFRIIHFPHIKDPHFTCACGLPQQFHVIQNIMKQCINVLAPCLRFYLANTQSNQKLPQQPKPKIKHINKIIPNP